MKVYCLFGLKSVTYLNTSLLLVQRSCLKLDALKISSAFVVVVVVFLFAAKSRPIKWDTNKKKLLRKNKFSVGEKVGERSLLLVITVL